MSEGQVGGLQPVEEGGTKGSVENFTCNGGVLRTSEPSKDDLTSHENRGHTDSMNTFSAVGDEECGSLGTHSTKDQMYNSKDPSCNSHTYDSTSSEDETEGEFAANWYVPLPQDPQQSDEEGEGDSENWSKGASDSLQGGEDYEEEEQLGAQSISSTVGEVKPASVMEDSEFGLLK